MRHLMYAAVATRRRENATASQLPRGERRGYHIRLRIYISIGLLQHIIKVGPGCWRGQLPRRQVGDDDSSLGLHELVKLHITLHDRRPG